MSRFKKLQAMAASARLANVPSVVSNVWLGCALAVAGTSIGDDRRFLGQVGMLLLAGVSLYLAGNFINDWADRGWDAAHRPERALPRGLFPPHLYLIVAVCCGLLGLGAAVAVHPWCLVLALGIVLNIIVYTRIHKYTAWAVIPMGLCRALLPVMGALGFGRPEDFSGWPTVAVVVLAPISAGLFCHLAGLSQSARNESLAERATGEMGYAPLLFAAAAALMFAWTWLACPAPVGLRMMGLLPYGLWITYCLTVARRPVSRQVANLLAGIPLVDWIVLLPVALAMRNDGRSPTYLTALCLLVPPLAFVAGKLLQRLAPAT